MYTRNVIISKSHVSERYNFDNSETRNFIVSEYRKRETSLSRDDTLYSRHNPEKNVFQKCDEVSNK